MELMEEIKELKKYKEDKDLPIAELARRIEADDTTVGRWLKGMATPSCYSLHKVRRFLKSVEGWEGLEPLEPFRREHEQAKKRYWLSKATYCGFKRYRRAGSTGGRIKYHCTTWETYARCLRSHFLKV